MVSGRARGGGEAIERIVNRIYPMKHSDEKPDWNKLTQHAM